MTDTKVKTHAELAEWHLPKEQTQLVEPPSASIAKTAAELKADRLRDIEDELFADSAVILGSVMKFAELDPGDLDTVPATWIAEYGKAEAIKRHRIARASWMNAKESPVALKMAQTTAIGITKARAAAGGGGIQNLNIGTMVYMPQPKFEVKEVD